MLLESLLPVFTETIAPVLAIVSIGYLLGTVRETAVEPLNTVTLYVLLPALIFHSLVTSSIGGGTTVKLAGGFVLFTVAMLAIAAVVGRLVGETGDTLSALVLASAFPNAGNSGLPIAEFAFGRTGRNVALLFVVVQNVMIYTFGVYVAGRGSDGRNATAVRQVFRLPLVYVVVIALAVSWLGVAPSVDSSVMQTLELLGNASIPLFLLILGMKLTETDNTSAVVRASPALVLKLVVAPLLGVIIALWLGFENPQIGRAFVLLSAGPSAVVSMVLLVEFAGTSQSTDGVSGTEYVSAVVFGSLLLAIPLATVLIFALKSGLVL